MQQTDFLEYWRLVQHLEAGSVDGIDVVLARGHKDGRVDLFAVTLDLIGISLPSTG
ncbi:MAG: hypothetical protein R2848_11105 [Thermomicrobiales bacterium]